MSWSMSGTITPATTLARRCSSSSRCSIIGGGCIRRSAMSARCSSKPTTLSPFEGVYGMGGSSACPLNPDSPALFHRLARLLLRFLDVEHQLVGHVVLEDVAHIRRRLDADLLGRDELHVVEPQVGIEAALLGCLAHARDVARPGAVGR